MNPLARLWPGDRLPLHDRWASTTASVVGIALLFVALGMVLATVVAVVDGRDAGALATATGMTGLIGLTLFHVAAPGARDQASVFSAVGATWLVASVLGSLPYLLAGTFAVAGRPWSVVLADALFESVSGFSCTGSTVFGAHNPIESHGPGILMYRQLTQWAGGMGIVVLVVMVLPSLRTSGLGLINAEAPGMGVDRLAPRISTTAFRFWGIYAGFTALVAVGLLGVGMGPFDAVAHALSTASTGGFSTRDASIGHWDSASIEAVLIVAMLIGGANFTLHSRLVRTGRITHHEDPEFRGYMTMIAAGTVLVTLLLVDDGMGMGRAFRTAVFNVVTLGTSSGFGNATGEGRVGLSHAYRTLRSFRRPRAVLLVRQGKATVPEHLVERIAGFMVVYGLLVVGGTMVVAALGTDLVTAVGGVIGALGNMGPALGEAGPTASFADAYSTPARLVLAALMLVGRLEIFPMLLMLVAPYRALDGATRGVRRRLRRSSRQ